MPVTKRTNRIYRTTPQTLRERKKEYKLKLAELEEDKSVKNRKKLIKQYEKDLELTKKRLKQSKQMRAKMKSALTREKDRTNFKLKVVNLAEFKNSKETLVEMTRKNNKNITLNDAKRLSKQVINMINEQTEASEDKEYKLIIRVANNNRIFTTKGLNTDLQLDVVDDYYSNKVKVSDKFVDALNRVEFLVIERNRVTRR